MNLAELATPEIMERARACAAARLALARRRGRSQPFGDPGDERRGYVDGWSSLAEALVAEWLGLEWNDRVIDDLSVKPPDVGTRVEVRWTPHQNGHLIAHPTDSDDAIMVLVAGELPEMRVVGWTLGLTTREYGPGAAARNQTDRWVPPGRLMLPELLWQMRNGGTL